MLLGLSTFGITLVNLEKVLFFLQIFTTDVLPLPHIMSGGRMVGLPLPHIMKMSQNSVSDPPNPPPPFERIR